MSSLTRRTVVPGLALVLGASGALAAPSQAHASKPAACSVSAQLNLGRGEATSYCVSPGPLNVNEHRAVIKCTVVRGRGNPHDITFTVSGPWVAVGKKSVARCPLSSSTAGYSYEKR
ncbi:hypothetical protein ACW14Y_04975 [Kitasatospora sp. cg17-2]